MKRVSFISIIAILAFLGGLSVRWLMSAPLDQVGQSDQRLLPEFSLSDLSGKQRNINEWQGKVLVINFWATWCPPCMKEMPEFEAMQKEFGSKGLQFIGIAIDDAEPVKEFITNKNITYPILLGEDQGTKIAHDLGNIVNTVPFTVIVDKNGRVIKTHMGELERDKLLEITKPLF
jgi:thiol-disulfide isomerase/thioredoxin